MDGPTMMSSTALDSALSGMQAASAMLNVAASNIANLNTPGYKARQLVLADQPGTDQVSIGSITTDPAHGPSLSNGSEGSNVDLTNQIVALSSAKNLYNANAAVIRAENQMTGSLLDVLANDN